MTPNELDQLEAKAKATLGGCFAIMRVKRDAIMELIAELRVTRLALATEIEDRYHTYVFPDVELEAQVQERVESARKELETE